MNDIEQTMISHGYAVASIGRGEWGWIRPTADGSVLRICTWDGQLGTDPDEPDETEWYVGRFDDASARHKHCEDYLSLADAIALAPRIPTPKGQPTDGATPISRAALEARA